MIFFVFFSSGLETISVVFVEGMRVWVVSVVVRSVLVVSGAWLWRGGCGGGSIIEGMASGIEDSTSVMLVVCYIVVYWFKTMIEN